MPEPATAAAAPAMRTTATHRRPPCRPTQARRRRSVPARRNRGTVDRYVPWSRKARTPVGSTYTGARFTGHNVFRICQHTSRPAPASRSKGPPASATGGAPVRHRANSAAPTNVSARNGSFPSRTRRVPPGEGAGPTVNQLVGALPRRATRRGRKHALRDKCSGVSETDAGHERVPAAAPLALPDTRNLPLSPASPRSPTSPRWAPSRDQGRPRDPSQVAASSRV